MKLKELAAHNYRTLQDIVLSFSSNYCTISGKNNAGKSSVIRLLLALFSRGERGPWGDEVKLDYKEDKTQWVKQAEPIEISYMIELSRAEDPALVAFIEKMSGTSLVQSTPMMTIQY